MLIYLHWKYGITWTKRPSGPMALAMWKVIITGYNASFNASAARIAYIGSNQMSLWWVFSIPDDAFWEMSIFHTQRFFRQLKLEIAQPIPASNSEK